MATPLRKITAMLAIVLTIASAASFAGAQKKPPPPKPRDINTMTLEQFEQLPGIGPVMAQRILDFRKASGPFRKVEDLLAVRGISKKRLEKMRHYIMVKPTATNPPPKKP